MKVFDFQVYDMQGGSFFMTVELSERTVYTSLNELMKRTIKNGVFDEKTNQHYPYHSIGKIRLVKESVK